MAIRGHAPTKKLMHDLDFLFISETHSNAGKVKAIGKFIEDYGWHVWWPHGSNNRAGVCAFGEEVLLGSLQPLTARLVCSGAGRSGSPPFGWRQWLFGPLDDLFSYWQPNRPWQATAGPGRRLLPQNTLLTHFHVESQFAAMAIERRQPLQRLTGASGCASWAPRA